VGELGQEINGKLEICKLETGLAGNKWIFQSTSMTKCKEFIKGYNTVTLVIAENIEYHK